MKTLLLALSLGSLASAATAADTPYYSPEITALRAECSAKYYPHEYQGKDAYPKGAYSGAKSECTEQQYAEYLESADPARVMAAYPSAAGRPAYKKDAAMPYKSDDPKNDNSYDKNYEKNYDKK